LIHLEMETNMRQDMTLRMLEYRARLRRVEQLRDRPLHQHVLVLNSGSPPGRPRSRAATSTVTVAANDQTVASYQVHLFRNLSAEPLLGDPITAVFAPLARLPARQRPAVLRRAVEIIATSGHPEHERHNLIECAGVLASLRINDPSIISTTIQEAAMPLDLSQSSIYREAEARGLALGEARGLALGEARGRLRGMLEFRFGPAGAQVDAQVLDRLSRRPDPARLITDADSLDDLLRQLNVARSLQTSVSEPPDDSDPSLPGP
jgi:hypothetical protein